MKELRALVCRIVQLDRISLFTNLCFANKWLFATVTQWGQRNNSKLVFSCICVIYLLHCNIYSVQFGYKITNILRVVRMFCKLLENLFVITDAFIYYLCSCTKLFIKKISQTFTKVVPRQYLVEMLWNLEYDKN